MPFPDNLRSLYPFESHSHKLRSGEMLHFIDEGEGVPIIFFHGNPTWSFFYRDLILKLRPQFRCLALDNLGCGLSAKPQSAGYRLEDHIERGIAWVESLGLERFHLVVHDWGGAIGLGVAQYFQESVRSLVILNSAAFPSWRIPLRIALLKVPGLGALAIRGANAFVRGALNMATAEGLSPAVEAGFIYPYGSWRDRVAILRFVQDIPLHPWHPSWKTLVRIEKGLTTLRSKPVFIAWGGRDFCFGSAFLESWKGYFPAARVLEYPDAGHYLLEDAGPELTEAINDWLRETTPLPE